MPYIPPETVSKAREMDLLTYLRNYEPEELVHFGGSTYCTREHDSLKISNGKWCWFSRGIGGTSALDYLIKVKDVPFLEAVERITGQAAIQPPVFASRTKQEKPKVLLLPKASQNSDRVIDYLAGRGIDQELISFCVQSGRLYESEPYHNAIFIGLEKMVRPGTPICGVPVRTSLATPTAVTSGTPLESLPLGKAIHSIYLNPLSTCYPSVRS